MKKKNLFRKMAIMTAFAFLGTSAMAEEYHYLTFETTAGAKASVEISLCFGKSEQDVFLGF